MNDTPTYDQGTPTEFECECELGMLHVKHRRQKDTKSDTTRAVESFYAMCPACKREFYARTHPWGTGRYHDTTLVTGGTVDEVIERIGQEIVRRRLGSL